MKATFTPDQFTGGLFYTQAQKAKLANDFVRFATGGYRWSQFNKSLYLGLGSMWGHISEYDRAGFYQKWFSDPERIADFRQQALTYWMGGQGNPTTTLSDVERALKAWMEEK